MSLYKKLVIMFHPDRCKEAYALERTKLINVNKDNERQLRRLAVTWGVIKPTADDIRDTFVDQDAERRRLAEARQRRNREAAEQELNRVRRAAERFRQAQQEQEELKRRWAQEAQTKRNARTNANKAAAPSKDREIELGFVRTGLTPNTNYKGLGKRVFTGRYGYVEVIKTTVQFVFIKDRQGIEHRASIHKCMKA